MAKRRCVSVDIMESDEFFMLDEKTRLLYLYLMLHSDDEGVVINLNTILRICGLDKKHLQQLIDTKFLLYVDGIYVITHWHIHNCISPSKKTESMFTKQLSKLTISDEKKYILADNCEKNDAVCDRLLNDVFDLQKKSYTI